MANIKLSAIRVTQPIGEFYIGVMDAVDLVAISYSDVRKMKREVEDYLGIQRELKKARVKDIKEYINTLDATFPNSIIVAIKGKYVVYKDGQMILTFDDFEKSRLAKVLDGQHRLAGFDEKNLNLNFKDVSGTVKPFQLLVTIFVESDISTQAKVFAMVNQNQTKVNPSLVYDLESLSISRSPDKTAHQIAVLLNKTEGSPFYKRIKRLGIKTIDQDGNKVEGETLAQAAFVSNVVKLISPKPKEDRNLLLGKKKKFLSFRDKNFKYLDSGSLKRCVFRECFVAEKDEVIALNISNYFEAVNKCWPEEWKASNQKSVLNKTVGFIALVRYLRTAINTVRYLLGLDGFSIISVDQFLFVLSSTEVPSQFFYSVDAVSKSSGQVFNNLNNNTFSKFKNAESINMVVIKNKLQQL
jgi:DGQHR domain-containing protein